MFQLNRIHEKKLVFHLKIPSWIVIIPLTICIFTALFCVFYFTHSREFLIVWYKAVGVCFYKSAEWPTAFFTQQVKHSGNYCAIAGLSLALIYISIIFRTPKQAKSINAIICRNDVIAICALVVIYILIWIYGYVQAYPAYDEVFSAINCAQINPFITGSYYMIPNNHVLFNLLNSLPAHVLHHPLTSGRIISGIAILLLIPILYLWLRQKTERWWISGVICLVALFQFPTWAFSFQARGYALYLLACWCSFIFLEHYIKTKNHAALYLHSVAIVVGFFTVPSFLFWELGLAIYIAFVFISRKSIDFLLIRAHITSGIIIFLLFTPLLCFSGIASLTENTYVKSGSQNILEFIKGMPGWFWPAIQYCFSSNVDEKRLSYVVLFIIPFLILPFLRNRNIFSPIFMACTAWIGFVMAEIIIRRFPFMRNMIAHDSIMLVALLLSFYYFVHQIAKRLTRRWSALSTTLFSALLLVHFIRFNLQHINNCIYFYDVDIRYKSLHTAVLQLPHDARVGLSDEGFYWEYLCQQQGIAASMCMGPSATHYIKIDKEVLPLYLEGHATKWLKADEYEIYTIK